MPDPARRDDQDAVEASVKQIVLAAYQLDNFGDLGDGEKIQEAFRSINTAIVQLDSLRRGARLMKPLSAAAGALAITTCSGAAGDAHKGVTSKFTFNAESIRFSSRRCSRCHADGGVGPMSLFKYEDAFPGPRSLRASRAAGRTAEQVDPHDFVKAAHRQIAARELDVVLEWATGGTP